MGEPDRVRAARFPGAPPRSGEHEGDPGRVRTTGSPRAAQAPALSEHGGAAPEDVAVVSFDGIAEAAYMSPSLTTVAQLIAEIAEEAVARLEAGDPMPEVTTMPTTLVHRRFCGCPCRGAEGSAPAGIDRGGSGEDRMITYTKDNSHTRTFVRRVKRWSL